MGNLLTKEIAFHSLTQPLLLQIKVLKSTFPCLSVQGGVGSTYFISALDSGKDSGGQLAGESIMDLALETGCQNV
jgi:hypothetical protein